MHKEMIHRFFLLQTHRASTRTAKMSSFKHVLRRDLAFGGRPSKETNFYRSFRLPKGFGSNIPTIQHFHQCGTKTRDGKDPLELNGHTMSSLP